MTALITTTTINTELRELINSARGRVSAAVNAELSQLYWRVGARINAEVLGGARANYGAAVVDQLGMQLSAEFGRNFEAKNLRRMMQFAAQFPDFGIVVTASRQLTWSHLIRLLPIKDPTARTFYAQMAVEHRWSVRELRAQIDRKRYERTQLASPNADLGDALTELQERGTLSPTLLFQDPYLLDFLGLQSGYLEADLELQLSEDGIQVAEYLTELPSKLALEQHLHQALIDARERMARKQVLERDE